MNVDRRHDRRRGRLGRAAERARGRRWSRRRKERDVAIGFEDGPADPKLAVTARRGTTGWEVRVTGKPAHSSQIFRDDIGYGAVYEVARILNAFREKMAGEAHLTFNPGVMLGGTTVEFDPVQLRGSAFGKTNVIAEHAVVSGDLRALSREQFESAKQTMTRDRRGVAAAHRGDDHVRRRLSADGARPKATRRLLAMYDQASRDLGFGAGRRRQPRSRRRRRRVVRRRTRCKMIIDGVGLMGHDDHTVKETADLTTLPSQTKRMAVLLHRIVKAGVVAR